MPNLVADTSQRVNSSHYNQSLRWDAVNSEYQTISNYSIKYGNANLVHEFNSTEVNTATSKETMSALTLPLPTSPTIYNVWVAAVGEETGAGEYSQVLRINLSGQFANHIISSTDTYPEILLNNMPNLLQP